MLELLKKNTFKDFTIKFHWGQTVEYWQYWALKVILSFFCFFFFFLNQSYAYQVTWIQNQKSFYDP